MFSIKHVMFSGMVCSLALLTPVLAAAGPMTLSSTTAQSNHSGFSGSSFPLTAEAYDYTSQAFQELASVETIEVTLTLDDGDTGLGDFDFDRLTLGLDGIDTGLKLNGFTNADVNPNQPMTLTFSGTPNNAAALLVALKSDGKLVGSVIDETPGDNSIGISGRFETTLDITGQQVPEPATLVLFGAGIAGLAGYAWRRRKLAAA